MYACGYVHLLNDKPHYLYIHLFRVVFYSHFILTYVCLYVDFRCGLTLVFFLIQIQIHKYANCKLINCVFSLHNLLALLFIFNRLNFIELSG